MFDGIFSRIRKMGVDERAGVWGEGVIFLLWGEIRGSNGDRISPVAQKLVAPNVS